jgi:hypothetical protein
MTVTDTLKDVWSKISKGAGNAAEKTKDVAGEAFDKTKEVASSAAEKTKEVAGTVVDKTKEVTHRGEARPDETVPPPVDESAGSE